MGADGRESGNAFRPDLSEQKDETHQIFDKMKFLKLFLAGLLAFVVGSFVVTILWIVVLIGIAGGGDTPAVVQQGSVLKIDLSEAITEAPSTDPFAGFDFMSMQQTPQLSLLTTLRAIEAAAEDDRIDGIYLRPNGTGGAAGAAVVEELRAALETFKQSGKFIVAYNEVYTQGTYYLASVADKIYLQPEGGMEWSGLSASLMFYKGLFDKLDLKMEVFRPTVCKYKSAVEPYIRTKMSPENRAQMQALTDSMWKTITEAVSASRNIPVEELNRLADELAVTLPDEAVEKGLVDGVAYEDEMKDLLVEAGASTDDDDEVRFVSLGDYVSQVSADLKHLSAPEVALVYAEGQIVDGEGGGKEIHGNTLAAQLREQRLDDNVKAVVLRVNSPGGSALASDIIWREMELLKAEKPVIVSMGSYAASGGYYISAPADAIVADKMTLTGSIGVFGMFPYTLDALKNKLGITVDGVKTNRSAGMGSTGPLTATERAAVMRGVDRVYATFTRLVAEGRNLPIEKVLDIAGGRVWSGDEALGIGLIDGYGGLKAAVALAADKADLGEDYRLVEKIETPSGFAALLSGFTARVKASVRRSELESLMLEYKAIEEAVSQRGVVMYSPVKVELQ